MQAKINPSREPANRKGWGSTSSIQPQVHLNKMGTSNASLLPFSTRYMPCSMVENLLPTNKAVFGQKLRTLPCSSRTSPFQQFFGKGKKSVLALMQKFGEMCITTFKDNTHWAKLANRGTPGIRVSYAENHPAGTYQIFNPKNKKNILTWDVTFLQKSYGEYTKVEKTVVLTTSYEGSDEEEELEAVPVINSNYNINVVSNSDSDSIEEDVNNNKEIFFDEDIDDQVNYEKAPSFVQ